MPTKLKTRSVKKHFNRLPKNGTSDIKIKLDLSYGGVMEGFQKPDGFDHKKTPWELGDESVEEAYCGFMLNRIPGNKRMEWMAELWRVLVPNGKCTVIVPYWSSPRAIQDPYSEWPPLCEHSFQYFNKDFRDVNKEPKNWEGYCDFDFTFGYTLDADTATKSNDPNGNVQGFWIKRYLNAVNDLHMVLTKRPKTSPIRT